MANHFPDLKIYIINNSDHATRIHSLTSRYEALKIIDTNPRIGFSRANNIGAEIAITEGADTIVSLNQDTILANDCLQQMISAFEVSNDIMVVSPITYKYDFGNIDEIFVKYYLSQCPELFYDALNGSHKKCYIVEKVSGACFAMKTSAIKAYGYFDKLYFMYSEDDDLCRKIRYCKGLICIAPMAKIAHLHSNRIENSDHVDKRYSWQRHSRAIYELKSLETPLYHNILKVIGYNSIDYLKAIFTLKFNKAVDYFLKDICLILNYPIIIKARKYERNLREMHISECVTDQRIKT